MSYSSYHKKDISGRPLHAETQMMSYGFDPFLSEGAVKPPVFLTSTFAFRSAEDGAEFFDLVSGRKPLPQGESAGLVYSRFNHPNLEIVEDRLSLLDGSEDAAVTSSGMSAISSVFLAFLRPGDQLVQSVPLYGGTETLIAKIFPEWGIGSHPIHDGLSAQSMRDALEAAAAKGPVKLFYVETPANPTNALIDFQAMKAELDAFAARHGYRPISVCDNTLLGPIFQKPAEHGVDLCVYSLTKYVGGHSDLVAGAVTGSKDLIKKVRAIRSAFGSQLDPHSCWMITRSMETVSPTWTRPCAACSERRAQCRFGGLRYAADGVAQAAAARFARAARTASGVKGAWWKRHPVASNSALAMAAGPGIDADSPAPMGASSWRGISSTSMGGRSLKPMMG